MWGNIAGAIGSIAGGYLSGGGGQDAVRPMEHIPEFMRDDYKELIGGTFDLEAPKYYGGDLVANINPKLGNALQQGYRFGAGGAGSDIMNTMVAGGNAGINSMNAGMDYLQGMQDRGPNQFRYGQNVFNRTMNNLMPGLQGSYDAAMRDPIRQMTEQTLPGINQAASLGGQGFGTRADNQSDIAMRGLADRSADTAAGLWQNAANQAQQAAMNTGRMNLGSANNFDQNMVSNYGRFGELGGDMLQTGYDMGISNIGQMFNTGQYLRDYKQQDIDANKAKWDYNQNLEMNHLTNQLNMLPRAGNYTPGSGGMTNWEGATQGLAAAAPFIQGAYRDWRVGQDIDDVFNDSTIF